MLFFISLQFFNCSIKTIVSIEPRHYNCSFIIYSRTAKHFLIHLKAKIFSIHRYYFQLTQNPFGKHFQNRNGSKFQNMIQRIQQNIFSVANLIHCLLIYWFQSTFLNTVNGIEFLLLKPDLTVIITYRNQIHNKIIFATKYSRNQKYLPFSRTSLTSMVAQENGNLFISKF